MPSLEPNTVAEEARRRRQRDAEAVADSEPQRRRRALDLEHDCVLNDALGGRTWATVDACAGVRHSRKSAVFCRLDADF